MIDDATLTEKAKWHYATEHGGIAASAGVCFLCDVITEIRRLRELNRIQRIALDFDPFAENRQLKADLAAHRVVVRELAQLLTNACTMRQNGGFVGDNIDRWFTGVILALAHPLVQQARGAEVIIKPAHVCGAWGYGQPGDSCPACDSVRRVQ